METGGRKLLFLLILCQEFSELRLVRGQDEINFEINCSEDVGFFLSSELVSFEEAVEVCSKNELSLAQISNMEEYNTVKDLRIVSAINTDFWIGD